MTAPKQMTGRTTDRQNVRILSPLFRKQQPLSSKTRPRGHLTWGSYVWWTSQPIDTLWRYIANEIEVRWVETFRKKALGNQALGNETGRIESR